ncbi:MAG: aminotransferase class V-fold PLP-dependent enzyme [Bacteroidales bacterium]|nr:aminotransferase class V-fold PLP-dependent enzyme [Bacteroidales bacterium]
MKLTDLQSDTNPIAKHYSKFRVSERLLLTGHSHQAWPDVAFNGIKACYEDAAEMIDNKWGRAFEKAEAVRQGYANLLDDEYGYIALGANTHELVLRFLSALPLRSKPKLITSNGEFHSIRRQLDRLSEEGIEVVKVDSEPIDDVAGKILAKLDDKTAAVLVSSVFFNSGLINPGIKTIAEGCAAKGVHLLVDAYHSLNVAPFSVKKLGLQQAFITGGGYKYCQLGEGNCFLRFPENFAGRPVITGWYSEFSLLAGKHTGNVQYGQGSDLFAGSTYDPVSHYRADEVFRFFRENNLTPHFLREVSQHQVGLLIDTFHALDLPSDLIYVEDIPLESRAGFLVLKSRYAGEIQKKLMDAGVFTDNRGESLRFGPAPYLSDRQVRDSVGILGEVVWKL